MKRVLVITSIAADTNEVLRTYAKECGDRNIHYVVIGDTKSPKDFTLEHCDYYGIESQQALPFELAKEIPTKHYARKNLGYLIAIKNGATEIQETDDDNLPYQSFWNNKNKEEMACSYTNYNWVNIYRYFTQHFMWARGFPLEELQKPIPELNTPSWSVCPIQQGLADGNPDVDAIYRLSGKLPIRFEVYGDQISLGKNSWHPFNSQNTYWFKDAFPLLYLPSYCSFRMTDIWRSYVAQRIAWECGWSIYYHEPTVFQERNEHNLMADFEDEVIGYTNNLNICKELQALELKQGVENIFENLVTCYDKLIDLGVVDKKEMILLNAWIGDLKNV
jgi:hypothetical protein